MSERGTRESIPSPTMTSFLRIWGQVEYNSIGEGEWTDWVLGGHGVRGAGCSWL